MGTTGLIAILVALSTPAATISRNAGVHQDTVFENLWGTPFVWKFDDLPTEGAVPKYRLPYSGYIYPDKQGGTASALTKYDRAFNRGRFPATAHERWDTTAFKKPTRKRGLFGLGRTVMETPNWHGHCNGWAAATIRHAEPQTSVRFNGVLFTPADIKALLAEIYIYNDLEHVAGLKHAMNAGTFHAIIANWVGRGRHSIGMEADPSEEKWNYPVYAYASSFAKRSERLLEVKMNLAYIEDSDGEYQESPHIQRYKYFHYQLNLDGNGNIAGGSFYRDSSRIDMLWIPKRPKPSRSKGNESGNPYVSVDRVLAIWRASVSEEERKRWLVVDPTVEDRVLEVEDDFEGLVPIQQFPPQVPSTASIAGTGTNSDDEGATNDPSVPDDSSPDPETSAVMNIGDEIPVGTTIAHMDMEDDDPVASTPDDDLPAEEATESGLNAPANA
ncbi:MAG: hypothetical protein ACC628_07070, partial [Pirellulaceae bacterium]